MRGFGILPYHEYGVVHLENKIFAMLVLNFKIFPIPLLRRTVDGEEADKQFVPRRECEERAHKKQEKKQEKKRRSIQSMLEMGMGCNAPPKAT